MPRTLMTFLVGGRRSGRWIRRRGNTCRTLVLLLHSSVSRGSHPGFCSNARSLQKRVVQPIRPIPSMLVRFPPFLK